MKAQDFVKNAKNELIEHIKPLVVSIATKLGVDIEQEGAYVQDFPNRVMVSVEVDNSYLDVEDTCYEPQEVVGVYFSEGDTPYIETEEGDEIYLEDLSIEELADLYDILQEIDNDTEADEEEEEFYKDINGVRIDVSDEVHWHDEAGYDEEGDPIIFTIVAKTCNGYFNLSYGDEDENPDRWAYYTELEIV